MTLVAPSLRTTSIGLAPRAQQIFDDHMQSLHRRIDRMFVVLMFAIVAILTLALGTGANTAIFQLVDAVRLRALPVQAPEQLVEIRVDSHDKGRTGSFLSRRPFLSAPRPSGSQ